MEHNRPQTAIHLPTLTLATAPTPRATALTATSNKQHIHTTSQVIPDTQTDTTQTHRHTDSTLAGNHRMALPLQQELNFAVNTNDIKSVRQILLAYPELVNCADRNNRETPLHVSCRRGLLDIAKLLIDHGADIHAANFRLDTPLHVACRTANRDIIRLLVARGAWWHAKNVCVACVSAHFSTATRY
jgi:hypothetical protein